MYPYTEKSSDLDFNLENLVNNNVNHITTQRQAFRK